MWGTLMSRRKIERELNRRIPVSITLDKELYKFIEEMIDRKIYKDRSHAINAALDYLKWTLQNNPLALFGPRTAPQNQQSSQQSPDKDQQPPH